MLKTLKGFTTSFTVNERPISCLLPAHDINIIIRKKYSYIQKQNNVNSGLFPILMAFTTDATSKNRVQSSYIFDTLGPFKNSRSPETPKL